LRAVADRGDPGIVGAAKIVADDDAPIDGEPCLPGQRGPWHDTGGHQHQVRGQLASVAQPDAADLSGAVLEESVTGRAGDHDQAQIGHRPAGDVGRQGVQLAVEDVRPGVDDRDLDAPRDQPASGLDAEQPTAEHDRTSGSAQRPQQAPAVGEGSQGVHRGVALRTHQFGDAGGRARGQDEGVVGVRPEAVVDDVALDAVDRDRRPSGLDGDPGRRLGQRQRGGVHRAGDDLGEQQPVVGGLRFLPQHGDLDPVGGDRAAQVVQEARGDHPVPHDHDPMRCCRGLLKHDG